MIIPTENPTCAARFAWDMEGPVKHLSLAQLKGKSEKLKDLVEQVARHRKRTWGGIRFSPRK